MKRRLSFLAATLLSVWTVSGATWPLNLIPWPSCC